MMNARIGMGIKSKSKSGFEFALSNLDKTDYQVLQVSTIQDCFEVVFCIAGLVMA